MELTTDNRNYLDQSAIGYVVNSLLSETTQCKVKELQGTFTSSFPDAVWAAPADALHITLLDWLAPLIDYGEDKDRMFERISSEYDAVLSSILASVEPIDITLNNLIVSPAAIAIVADEKSTLIFNDIRQQFREKINLPPNTKQLPSIVHSTIIRFTGEMALNNVRRAIEDLDFSLAEQVTKFQLVRETALPMLSYSVIKKYPLHY